MNKTTQKSTITFLLACLCFGVSGFRAAANVRTDPLLANREIFLKSFHQDSLNGDLPASAVLLEGSKALWIAGQRSLWKWNFHKNKLFKVPLTTKKQKSPGFKFLLHRNQEIFVAGERILFQIRFRPLKVFRYTLKDERPETKTIALRQGRHSVYWVLNTGIQILHPGKRLLSRHQGSAGLKQGDQIYIPGRSDRLWIVRGRNLLLHHLNGEPYNLRQAFRLSYPLKGIGGLEKGFLLNTGFAVLLMSPSGEVAKTIPVEGKFILHAMDIRKSQHSYLFRNSLVEIIKTGENKNLFTRLPLGDKVRTARSFQSHHSMIALTDKGKPRVFQLEGVW